MPDLVLTYFDIDGGRGEPARLALSHAGIEFTDRRISFAEFRDQRESLPFRRVPTLEVDGEVLTQSGAINRYVGKLAGLYPDDPWQAARCDEVLESVEDAVAAVVNTFGLKGEALVAARARVVERFHEVYLPRLGAMLELRGDTFVDGQLTVADLSVFVWVRSLRSGRIDHIPADVVDRLAPALVAHEERIAALPSISEYYARRA